MNRPPLYVLEPPVIRSQETILVLKRLLEDAESGRLTGLALAAIYQSQGCSVELTGTAKLSPIFTSGALHKLQLQLDRTTIS